MTLGLRIAAAALLGLAVLLPAGPTAELLAGEENELLPRVVEGARILRWMLVLNGLLLAALSFWRGPAAADEPLLERGAVEPEPAGGRDLAGLVLLLAVGTALRLHELGSGLWFDEIDTLVHYVRLPLGEVLTTYQSKNHHLLYSLLANLSFTICGDSAFALRLPAALLGVASLWATWLFARLVAPRREAWLAAALLAVSYHHVDFSQNARGYTGLLLFTLLGSTALWRMLTDRGPSRPGLAVGYGLAMACAVATHATATLIVAGQGLVWLAVLWTSRARAVGRRRWLPGWGFVFATTFSLLLYALVLPQFLDLLLEPPMPEAMDTDWDSPLWMVTETLRGLAAGLPGGWLGVAAAAGVGLAGIWSYARQSGALLGLMLLGSLLTVVVVLVLHHHPWPRYFFFAAGFFVLIAFRGMAAWLGLATRRADPRLAGRLLVGLGSLVVLGSALTLPRSWGPKQDFERALAWVEERRGADEALVSVDMTTLPLQKHLAADCLAVDTLDDLLAVEGRSGGVWVMYTFPTRLSAVYPDLWEHLQAHYEEVEVFPGSVNGGALVVVRR